LDRSKRQAEALRFFFFFFFDQTDRQKKI